MCQKDQEELKAQVEKQGGGMVQQLRQEMTRAYANKMATSMVELTRPANISDVGAKFAVCSFSAMTYSQYYPLSCIIPLIALHRA